MRTVTMAQLQNQALGEQPLHPHPKEKGLSKARLVSSLRSLEAAEAGLSCPSTT